MQATLAWTALLMGVAGGPHCAAMCGAACAGVVRMSGVKRNGTGRAPSAWRFQLGRLLGYCAAGAAAATAIQSLAWLSEHASALRPAWTLVHVAVFAWGVVLLVGARQPAWVESGGRAVWSRVRPVAAARGGQFATGALWAFVPCGLLYSALLAAALSGDALDGALFMALFAAGSGLSLAAAPWLLRYVHDRANRWRRDGGTRLAGLLLCGVAVWALWMDLGPRIAQWCA